ncbi:hypothetical protein [Fibrivirga algicola]|uniref:hypothetical protein n=1 Tax=Fibrivirga algicola TaxID=2950420 RepID=UPI001E598235|nr:hypothetical protein [Fibrivirga algicola]
MSFNPAPSRIASATGLFTVCLLIGLSACQRPVAQFQRSNREVFYSPVPKATNPDLSANPALAGQPTPDQPADELPGSLPGNVPSEPAPAQTPVAYAQLPAEPTGNTANGPVRTTYSTAERIGQRQNNARRLLQSAHETGTSIPASEHQPGPKPKKTLREILGLPPRKKLNWWQRISWQLKASIIVIAVALLFAVLNITILAIVFGVVGALLLIRGLKKSFKVKRPWF